MSNTERQRRFRMRNPGYYGRLHARRKASLKAAVAAPETRTPLMLPAPVEVPIIPGINTIRETPAPEPLPLRLTISRPAERSIADFGEVSRAA